MMPVRYERRLQLTNDSKLHWQNKSQSAVYEEGIIELYDD